MTGTTRDSSRAASRLLSLWSDTALDEVEGGPARRARASGGRSSRSRSPSASAPTSGSRSGDRSSGGRSRPPSSGRASDSRSGGRSKGSRGAVPYGADRQPAARRTDSRSGSARTAASTSSRTTPSQRRQPVEGGRTGSSRSGGSRSAGDGTRRTSPGPRRGRTGTARPSSRSTASRSRSTAEAPAAFRARRGGNPGTRGAAGGRSARRSRPPVTEIGERHAAYLTVTVLGLTLFGLVMVLSASSVSSLHQLADSPFYQFKRQLMWAGIGAMAFVVASRIDYRRLRVLAGPLMLVTIGLLVALLIPGVGLRENGSVRWLGVGPIVIQPSELAKLALIIFVADLLARRERRMDRPELTVRPVMLVLVLLSGLIVLQPKLGTPIILSGVTILMLFVAGARMRSLSVWLAVAVAGTSFLAFSADYRRARLMAFMNPWEDPLGVGLQSIQSQVGVASGGLYGVGLGASRAKWGFLPFAHTDFIFAIVAEEVGLIGASALIGGFLLVCWFGLRTAVAAPDRFGTLLAAGITSWILVQAFMNIGMVLGVLPITGEALPFVSAGGSSLVVTLTAAGILTSVARRARN